MKPWREVEVDPDFLQLPQPEQQKVRAHYLSRAEADAAFQGLPDEEKSKVRTRIGGALQRGGLADKVRQAREAGYSDDEIVGHIRPRLEEQVKAASAAGFEPAKIREHLIGQGIPESAAFDLTASGPEKVARAAAPAIEAVKAAGRGIADRYSKQFEENARYNAAFDAAPIPGLHKVAELQARGPENAANVAQAVAQAGYPRLATAAGVAAGAPTTLSQVVTPVPGTVGEAKAAAPAVAAIPAALDIGGTIPFLSKALPPAKYIGNVLKRRLGLGGPTDLVPSDPRAALAKGNISVANAAKADPAIFAEELAKRGLQPEAAAVGMPGNAPGGPTSLVPAPSGSATSAGRTPVLGPSPLVSEAIQGPQAAIDRRLGLAAPSSRRGQGGFARLGTPEPGPAPASPELEAYKAKIHAHEPPSKTIAERGEDLFTQLVDKNNPILNLRKKAGEMPDGEDVRLLLDRYMGSGGIAEQRLNDATTALRPDGSIVQTGEGLKPILRQFDDRFGKKAFDDLKAYMLAQRDIEVGGRGIHGLDPKNAPAVVEQLRAKYGPDLDAYADRVRQWEDRALLQPLHETGVLSSEQLAQIRAKGKFYVPYDRVLEAADPAGAAKFASGAPVKTLKGSEREVYDPFDKMVSAAYRVAEFAERNRVHQATVQLRNSNPALAELITEAKEPGRDTVRVFYNGEPRHFHVPPDVQGALDNLQVSGLDLVGRILSTPAAIQRAGVTLDPQFALARNPIRDQFTAAMHAKYGYVPGVDYFRGLFHAIGKDALYNEWIAAGGDNAAMVGMDRMNAKTTLRELRGIRELDSVNPLTLLQKVSEFGEKGTRLGVFARARASGASPLEAAYESKEATVNFGIRGQSAVVRFLSSVIAFMRPNILSSARFFRAFKEAPGRTAFRATSMITLPSIALWNLTKDNPKYQELPLWRKNLFWHVPVGDRLLEIPKPFEYGVLFGSGPERVLDWLYHKDPKAVSAWAHQALESFTPPVIPTAIGPALAAAADYNPFTRRSIVPKSRERLLPEDQAGEYTSEVSRAIGRRLGASPSKIDFLVGGYLGTLGRRGLNAGDAIMRALNPKLPPPIEKPIQDVMFARDPIGSNSESVNRFYAALDQLEREHASQAAKTPFMDIEPGPELMLLREAGRQIRQLRDVRGIMAKNKTMIPEEKKSRLDRIDAAITRQAANILRVLDRRR